MFLTPWYMGLLDVFSPMTQNNSSFSIYFSNFQIVNLVRQALSNNPGFSAKELRDMEKIIIENQQHLLETWYEYPGH
jgi:hypothetical protein